MFAFISGQYLDSRRIPDLETRFPQLADQIRNKDLRVPPVMGAIVPERTRNGPQVWPALAPNIARIAGVTPAIGVEEGGDGFVVKGQDLILCLHDRFSDIVIDQPRPLVHLEQSRIFKVIL